MKYIRLIVALVLIVIGYVAFVPNYAAPRKVSVSNSVRNNLRQIAGVGQQALLESGKAAISYGEIEALKWFTHPIKSYDGEGYTHISIIRSGSVISAATENHGVIDFAVDALPEIPKQ